MLLWRIGNKERRKRSFIVLIVWEASFICTILEKKHVYPTKLYVSEEVVKIRMFSDEVYCYKLS